MDQNVGEPKESGSMAGKLMNTAKNEAASTLDVYKEALRQTQFLIKAAFAHQQTITELRPKLPIRFYEYSGIYEKPKKPSLTIRLVTEDRALDQALMAVSVIEDVCPLRDVDAIASLCGGLPFGE